MSRNLRRRKLISSLLLALLLAALPVVGVVQYRWLNEVSGAEADRMRRAVGTAGRQIIFDLSFEAAGIATLLEPDIAVDQSGESFREELSERMPAYLEAWKNRTDFPGLIAAVQYVDRSAGEPVVYDYDESEATFIRNDELTGARLWADAPADQIAADGMTSDDDQSEGASAIIGPLTIPIPIGRTVERVATDDGPTRLQVTDSGYLLVQIDRDYLATVVVPELASDYLGTGAGGYEVAVVDAGTQRTLWSSVARDASASASPLQPDTVIPISTFRVFALEPPADFSLPDDAPDSAQATQLEAGPERAESPELRDLFFRTQEPVIQQWLGLRGHDGGELAGRRDASGGLEIHIWHSAGGIRAAATATRNRNLIISYVVLGLLGGAAVTYFLLFRRASRLREREREFVASVTHELRTPVAAMQATADNLAEGVVSDPEQVRRYGASLLGESRRLRTMIDQVLLYSRLQSGNGVRSRTSIDVPEFVSTCCDRIGSAARDRLIIRTEPHLPRFRGDPIAIESIITNLVTNALKHNADTTTVTLAVGSARDRKRLSLVIAVRDNGRGIPRRELGRVREPFFRGAESQANQVAGSGLGLSLVERIVDSFGGSMEIQSAAGQGTRVTVRLPFEGGETDEGADTDR